LINKQLKISKKEIKFIIIYSNMESDISYEKYLYLGTQIKSIR